MAGPITPLAAATVMLVHDGEQGLEVLMLERNPRSGWVAGAYLFPGGAVDLDDSSPALAARCRGRDDATASALLGMDHGGLAHWVAALRETFEEAGVLLAEPALEPAHRDERRRHVDRGEVVFSTVCEEDDLVLATDHVWAFSHWITPEGQPRRYDTRFFLAVAPDDQQPSADLTETVAHLWIRPEQALERHAAGDMPLIEPTVASLRTLAGFERAEQVVEAARQAEEQALVSGPRWVGRLGGRRIPLPGDPDEPVGAAR